MKKRNIPRVNLKFICKDRKQQFFKVEKDAAFSLTVQVQATDLTLDLLQNGAWKEQSFKKYNFDAEGVRPEQGHLHPLMKMREEIRQVFFEMGYVGCLAIQRLTRAKVLRNGDG